MNLIIICLVYCYSVNFVIASGYNLIEEQLKHAEKNGVKLIDASPRKGAKGLDIAFFHPFILNRPQVFL